MVKQWGVMWAVIGACVVAGCQKPTDPSDVIDFDEVVDVTVTPNPIQADTQTGGRTYRVVRGNNQPDDILPYDWHTVFSATVTFNDKANDDDVDITFPVRLTATTLTVKQAVGGIITPPSGSDVEKYEFTPLSATGNQFAGVATPISLAFELWYDLPNLRKEAVVTLSFAFVDDEGVTFQKVMDVNVAP